MGKKRTKPQGSNDIEVGLPDEAIQPQADAKPQQQQNREVSITVRVAPEHPGAYAAQHLELRLDRRQRDALKRVRDALPDNGARRITTADAVRHLLNQIAASL